MKAVIKHQQQWGIAELLPLKKYENGIISWGSRPSGLTAAAVIFNCYHRIRVQFHKFPDCINC